MPGRQKKCLFMGNLNIVYGLKEKSFGQKKMGPGSKFCHFFQEKNLGRNWNFFLSENYTTFSNFGGKNSPNFGFQFF